MYRIFCKKNAFCVCFLLPWDGFRYYFLSDRERDFFSVVVKPIGNAVILYASGYLHLLPELPSTELKRCRLL